MNYSESRPKRFVMKIEQHESATLAVWLAQNEVGCEVLGEARDLTDKNIAELCFNELKAMPGFEQVEKEAEIEVFVSIRCKRREVEKHIDEEGRSKAS